MSSAVYTCKGCGAPLSIDQMRGKDCPYCRAAFPHHARAVEHAAVVQQVMAQNMTAAAQWIPQVMPPIVFGVDPPPAIAPLPTYVGQQVNLAMKRTQQAILAAVAISIGMAVFGTVLSFVLLP